MRIVVVEADTSIRSSLDKAQGIENLPHELVGTATDGEEGLALIEETKPDLVLFDIALPKMDGLTMLARMRQNGLKAKAIVVSDQSDFIYVKMAMELGTEDYLIKPVPAPELARAMRRAERVIMEEEIREKFFSPENIFLQSAVGQFISHSQLETIVKEDFGLDIHQEIAVFLVRLGEDYPLYRDTIKALLKEADAHSESFSSCILEFDDKFEIVMLLYEMQNEEELKEYFQKAVLPMLSGYVNGRLICAWEKCEGLANLHSSLETIRNELEWNLVSDVETILSSEKIQELQAVPVKYPVRREIALKQAVVQGNEEEFFSGIDKLTKYLQSGPYHPQDIKEVCVRCYIAMFQGAKEAGRISADVSVIPVMRQIARALSWRQIRQALCDFFGSLSAENEEQEESVLIQRALALLQESYHQGITLEEIAVRLRVSKEYLSARFKKETGRTFTEIIREYRVEKVKELLLNSELKLNQIADMAGYADSKYMSKVFKREVGVTPAEYRRINN